jgi:hypothetical protein
MNDIEELELEASIGIQKKPLKSKDRERRVRRSTYEKAMALAVMYRNSCIRLKWENDELKSKLASR